MKCLTLVKYMNMILAWFSCWLVVCYRFSVDIISVLFPIPLPHYPLPPSHYMRQHSHCYLFMLPFLFDFLFSQCCRSRWHPSTKFHIVILHFTEPRHNFNWLNIFMCIRYAIFCFNCALLLLYCSLFFTCRYVFFFSLSLSLYPLLPHRHRTNIQPLGKHILLHIHRTKWCVPDDNAKTMAQALPTRTGNYSWYLCSDFYWRLHKIRITNNNK